MALDFFHHSPYTSTPSDSTLNSLKARFAPGEMVSLSFSMKSDLSIDPLFIDCYPVAGSIPELYLAPPKRLSGRGIYQNTPVVGQELLLKSDTTPIQDHYRRDLRHISHIKNGIRKYVPPDLSLSGSVSTFLKSNSPKQLWVSFAAPRDLAPGEYSTQIEFTASRKVLKVLDVVFTVLPIQLIEPEQERFIWYKATMDTRKPQHCVSKTLLKNQLTDIYSHGFNSFSVFETKPALVKTMLSIAREIGFRGNVVLMPPFEQSASIAIEYGFSPICYISDELDLHGPSEVKLHKANLATARRLSLPTMASFVYPKSYTRILSKPLCPEYFSFYLPKSLSKTQWSGTFYYWMSHMEKPLLHRTLAGLYLWRSGAKGIAPYCYQHLPKAPNSPYDDFSFWDDGPISNTPPMRHHLTTYPAKKGSVPTIQWKALSEGITDLKYLTTLQSLLISLPSVEEKQRTIDRINTVASRIMKIDSRFFEDTQTYSEEHFSAMEFEGFRNFLKDQILIYSKRKGWGL